MHNDRQAKTSQTTLFINIESYYNEDAYLECTSDGQEDKCVRLLRGGVNQ
jgi:hypothetical protein